MFTLHIRCNASGQNGDGACTDKVQVQPNVKVGENHCLRRGQM